MKDTPESTEATGESALPEPAHAPLPTTQQLFLGFLGLGMMAFGGALPLAHRMLVEQKRWLSEDEFTEMLGLCQFLPGGNMINMSVAVGMRFRGVRGGIAGLLGLIAVPSMTVVLLGVLYQRYQNDPQVEHMFAGLAAAAAGLLVAMAIKIVRQLRGGLPTIAVALVSFAAIALLRLPLLWTMLVMTPLSILLVSRLRK